MVEALVLSGGAIERERFPGVGADVARKAEVPILGRPMVEWVVRGLRACPQTGRIVVVGQLSLDTPPVRELGAVVVLERNGIAANLRAGLEALPGSQWVLALSGDLPLLTQAALEDFFARAPAADVVFPYVARDAALGAFPNREWVFSRLRDGAFTGSSAALFRPAALLGHWGWVEAMLNARRCSPLGLALLIGPSLGVKYGLGRLRIEDIEKKLSSLLHLTGRGYQSRFAELAMDVDKQADIELVETVLRLRGQAVERNDLTYQGKKTAPS